MKNEIARREIESLDYYLQNHTNDYSEESHTAMMMAIKALEQQPCDDAISRDAVIEWLENATYEDISYAVGTELSFLPSVTQKSGKWIEQEGWDGDVYYECSVCGEPFCLIDGTPTDNMYNYCPNCGAKMESEVNNG